MRLIVGVPVVRTDGRAYGHVITKFSRIGGLPHFLSYGAPSTRASPARGAPLKSCDANRRRQRELQNKNNKALYMQGESTLIVQLITLSYTILPEEVPLEGQKGRNTDRTRMLT